MEWVIAVIVVVVIGLAAALATGALGAMRAEPVRDQYRQPLPAGPLSGTDVHDLRFGVTLRGYSMAQVDEVIDRLSAEIAERDRRLGDADAAEPSSDELASDPPVVDGSGVEASEVEPPVVQSAVDLTSDDPGDGTDHPEELRR